MPTIDYPSSFREHRVECSDQYPLNDIGLARLFYDLHARVLCYVVESKAWYIYNGKVWSKDEEALGAMEYCKSFAEAFLTYAHNIDDGSEQAKLFVKRAAAFQSRRRKKRRDAGRLRFKVICGGHRKMIHFVHNNHQQRDRSAR